MKIAVMGAGNVGRALGIGWAKAGHQVSFGVRDPEDPALQALTAKASVTLLSPVEAARGAEVVLFALPYTALESVAKDIASELGGKILLDCTNPINGEFSGIAKVNESAARELASATGSNKVVKVLNTVGFNIMEDPKFPEGAATMLYCGDDAEAKNVAAGLAKDLGFDPVDAGPLSEATYLEHFAWTWISLALKYGQGRDIAFRLMRR